MPQDDNDKIRHKCRMRKLQREGNALREAISHIECLILLNKGSSDNIPYTIQEAEKFLQELTQCKKI